MLYTLPYEDARRQDEAWRSEYLFGASHESYQIKLPPCCARYLWREVPGAICAALCGMATRTLSRDPTTRTSTPTLTQVVGAIFAALGVMLVARVVIVPDSKGAVPNSGGPDGVSQAAESDGRRRGSSADRCDRPPSSLGSTSDIPERAHSLPMSSAAASRAPSAAAADLGASGGLPRARWKELAAFGRSASHLMTAAAHPPPADGCLRERAASEESEPEVEWALDLDPWKDDEVHVHRLAPAQTPPPPPPPLARVNHPAV